MLSDVAAAAAIASNYRVGARDAFQVQQHSSFERSARIDDIVFSRCNANELSGLISPPIVIANQLQNAVVESQKIFSGLSLGEAVRVVLPRALPDVHADDAIL